MREVSTGELLDKIGEIKEDLAELKLSIKEVCVHINKQAPVCARMQEKVAALEHHKEKSISVWTAILLTFVTGLVSSILTFILKKPF